MRLIKFLNELDMEELLELARELRVSIFKDSVRSYFERKIVEKLTRLDYLNKIIVKLDKPCITTLAQLVYFGTCSNKKYLDVLRKKGLVYKDMQVPDDVKELLEECLYPKISRSIRKKWEVKETPFLNLILLIGLMQRDEINIKKLKNNSSKSKIKAENKNAYSNLERDRDLLINFLEHQDIVYWKDNILLINRPELLLWNKKDNATKFELLYNWLRAKNKKVHEMVAALSRIQNDIDDWIEIDVFVEGDIPYTKETIEKFGLVSFCKIKDQGFVKLTPVVWYCIKGIYSSYWYSKSILISADFEVFIPHDFDPNIISLLDKYGQLKDFDYFLVYDIDPSNLKKELLYQESKSYQMFIEELEIKSDTMPQVVDYELRNFSKELSSFANKPII
ncbi:MAG: hypothetical protein K9L56_14780 [Clostridiales bacterium]|nr:hypothetical protein [Clostridiales bacterium]